MILDVQRGHIKVGLKGRTATIGGETFLPGFGSPSFVANLESLQLWDPPFETEEISAEDKSAIIAGVRKEFEEKNMTIEFV